MESDTALLELEARKQIVIDLSAQIMRADGTTIYLWDMVAMACAKRALSMIDGYVSLIRRKNFICAAPLLRLHLDTLLRFFAGSLVSDPHDLARRILAGEKLQDIPDRNGTKMRDSHLVSLFSQQQPWIRPTYKKASGYIHLSGLHVWNTFLPDDGSGHGAMAVTATDNFVDDEARLRTTEGMIAITDLLIQCLDAWRFRKENPKNAAAHRPADRRVRCSNSETADHLGRR